MVQVVATLSGSGIPRLISAADAIGSRGQQALKRGLSDGGRKTRTLVRRAIVDQSGVKAHAVSSRTNGALRGSDVYVIKGWGKGVPILEVKGLRVGKLRERDPRKHPRDARGRFVEWPYPQLERGLVSANVWNERRRFWRSAQLRSGRLAQLLPERTETLYGPSVPKEMIKDQSASAFRTHGPRLVEEAIARRIVKLGRGAVARR